MVLPDGLNEELEDIRQRRKEIEKILWSKSPYQKGDKVHLVTGDDKLSDHLVEIVDIGFFERDEFFPFEYNCVMPDGETMWIKGRCCVRPDQIGNFLNTLTEIEQMLDKARD